MRGGDLTGDGVDDLVLGIPQSYRKFPGRLGGGIVGHAVAFFGPFVSGTILDGTHPQVYDVQVLGSEWNHELSAGLAVGDATGDGIADLIVADPVMARPEDPADFWAGRVHVFLGPLAAGSVFDLESDLADVTVYGPKYSALGAAPAVADVSGDGIGDLVLAGDRAYVGGSAPRWNAGEGMVLFGPLRRGTSIDLDSEEIGRAHV